MCTEVGDLFQLVYLPDPLWPEVQVYSEWPMTSLSVCTFQEVHTSRKPLVLGYSGFYFFPLVIFLQPFSEMIIFRHFTHGYINKSVLSKECCVSPLASYSLYGRCAEFSALGCSLSCFFREKVPVPVQLHSLLRGFCLYAFSSYFKLR